MFGEAGAGEVVGVEAEEVVDGGEAGCGEEAAGRLVGEAGGQLVLGHQRGVFRVEHVEYEIAGGAGLCGDVAPECPGVAFVGEAYWTVRGGGDCDER
ncbi:hypothetical protein AB0P20_06155 [Streptomyces nigra]